MRRKSTTSSDVVMFCGMNRYPSLALFCRYICPLALLADMSSSCYMTYARQKTLAIRVALECLAWPLFDQGTVNNRLEFEDADKSRGGDFLIRGNESLAGGCL